MLVRDRMTAPAIPIDPKTPIYDALSLMKEKRIRRFPVVKGRRLVGVVISLCCSTAAFLSSE